MPLATPTHLFNKTISTERPVQSVDSGGAVIETFATHLSDIKCRIQPVGGAENLRAGRLAESRSYRVYVSPGHDIEARDRIKFGARYLKIVEMPVDFDELGVLTRLICTEVTP